jgi:hypothetical protein
VRPKEEIGAKVHPLDPFFRVVACERIAVFERLDPPLLAEAIGPSGATGSRVAGRGR